jgi:Protein of unknown function (DUF4197)
LCLALVVVGQAAAALDRITSREAASALKAALERGSSAAVASLGREDGFLGNPQVRIPLPESMQKTDKLMRRLGMGRHADELILAMNRAAEAAVPQARAVFVESIRKMTLADAKAVLQGGETSGTEYFRRSSEERLRERFRPIVEQATGKVALARHFENYAEKGVALGIVDAQDADLDDYVTRKALAGLFVVLAAEERKLRANPASAGSALLRKVYGAL